MGKKKDRSQSFMKRGRTRRLDYKKKKQRNEKRWDEEKDKEDVRQLEESFYREIEIQYEHSSYRKRKR